MYRPDVANGRFGEYSCLAEAEVFESSDGRNLGERFEDDK